MEDLKQTSATESFNLQKRSEESLNQLKLYYETERERLEKRGIEEKERYDRRLAQAIDEYEAKIKEDQGIYEEEIDTLREEIKVLNEEREKIEKKHEHDLFLKQQSIETLEKYLNEAKENLLLSQESSSKSLEQHLVGFAGERKSLVEKNEALMNEIAKKDKEIMAISQIKEALETNLENKEAGFETFRREKEEERKNLEKKVEEIKNL